MGKTLISLVIAGALFGGCGREGRVDNKELSSVPTISYESRTPVGEKIDPKNISPTNDGYTFDIDGDSIPDFAIMRGNTLYFSKGLGNGRFERETPILKINGNLIAYNL